jgi:hypothetical protein
MPRPKSIIHLTNKELIAEKKRMQSGRVWNDIYEGKTWATHVNEEITERKKKNKMKKIAGSKRKTQGFGFNFAAL